MHIGKWAILLIIFWLLLSGFLQPLLLSFGAVSVALVLWILHRMDTVDKETQVMRSGHRMLGYLLWLLGQIISSSIHVTKLIWSSNQKLAPTLDKIPASDIPPEKRVLYANSITLTPGTLSVDLEDGEVTVHALQSESIEKLKQKAMETKITDTWGKSDD